jgi:hypothetical protein
MLTPVPPAYDKKSLALLGVVVATGVTAGVVWREYVSLTWADFDPLLVFCWLLMTALAAWRFSPRRDLPLAVVAFLGGAMIETWGTRSGLWTYFTHEKPPLFILPAWPLAALATERIARALGRLVERTALRLPWSGVQRGMLLGFAVMLWGWTSVGRHHPTTAVAYAFVVGTIAVAVLGRESARADVFRFLAGAVLGWLLEYWGTTRQCWTYWDRGTPPLVAVFSHGFASVAFARATSVRNVVFDGIRKRA